jgi:hypothetical protein
VEAHQKALLADDVAHQQRSQLRNQQGGRLIP